MRDDNHAGEFPDLPTGRRGLRRADHGALMIETLETGLSRLAGDRVRVRAIRDKNFAKGTSFAIRPIDVELESGERLPVIFKDLNPLRQAPTAKRVRRLELGRSRRELWMYQQVLPSLGLGTPRLYGSRWEPERGNLWLFLEDVGPHRLGHSLDLDRYVQAAAWAARFHAAAPATSGDERLLRFDRAYYERLGRRLEARLERVIKQDRPLVERALAGYGELVQLVDVLPSGMIHGEFFGKNVLLRPDRSADAIAVIDWETAAIGPRYVDLVSISAGRWTRSQRMAMRRAYFEAGNSTAARPPGHPPAPVQVSGGERWDRFNAEVDLVALLQAVGWLGFWASGDVADRKYVSRVSRWIRELRLGLGEDVPP
jgi:aminoglycoside/choline kinase family phosphotransferase